jgi:NAD(P)-dependent dehydrogenase (short-subunit alcohol dehydrogenase family)
MSLQGKVAVITGGASGIGRASSLKLAKAGAKIVVADLNEAGGQETVAAIKATGGEATFQMTDVSDFAQVERAVNVAVQTYGNLDIMFNNAGTGHMAPLLMHEPTDYDRVVKVNQYGVYHGILAAGRTMSARGTKGVIINTSSVLSFMASQAVIGYQAAKGAVTIMTKVAALELAPYGIRVVAIAPGGVDTPIIQGYKDMGLTDLLAQGQMRRELQTPEQIADVVYLLCLDEANAINGSVVMTEDGYVAFKV